ncbi:hypothetical protein LBMAG27_21590 [Bacteroidota bacterium]|nr:hypothetical protein LBMAG27_21590 [Bacteroidota bacterium]
MATNISNLKKLSISERILLVEELWDSIATDKKSDDFEFDSALKKELDERVSNHEKGISKSYSWKEAKQRIRKAK